MIIAVLTKLARPDLRNLVRAADPQAPGRDLITLTGTGLASTREVRLAGQRVDFTVVSDAILRVAVARDASGDLEVSNPFGSETFRSAP